MLCQAANKENTDVTHPRTSGQLLENSAPVGFTFSLEEFFTCNFHFFFLSANDFSLQSTSGNESWEERGKFRTDFDPRASEYNEHDTWDFAKVKMKEKTQVERLLCTRAKKALINFTLIFIPVPFYPCFPFSRTEMTLFPKTLWPRCNRVQGGTISVWHLWFRDRFSSDFPPPSFFHATDNVSLEPLAKTLSKCPFQFALWSHDSMCEREKLWGHAVVGERGLKNRSCLRFCLMARQHASFLITLSE